MWGAGSDCCGFQEPPEATGCRQTWAASLLFTHWATFGSCVTSPSLYFLTCKMGIIS